MKLSICMMVKNEEKILRKCLESLQELREKIDSELIIVDTGSQDSTVEIAKEFTEKVYFHEWNNDFSAMRNITISYAQGEWIFIIDGDEVVENSEEIIKVINSKVPNKFGALTLTVRNFTSSSENAKYISNESPRLFRNDGFFKYEGAVHNTPVYKGDLGKIPGDLLHYGYVKDDKELMEYKFNRTSAILKEVLKKNPKSIYYIYQLSVSYQMHDEYDKALEEIQKAYLLLENDEMKNEYAYIYGLYTQLLLSTGKYQEVIKRSLEGITFVNEYIDLYYYLGSAYAQLENYEEAAEAYVKYLDLVHNWENLSVRNNTALIFKTLSIYEEAYYNLSVIYHRIKKYEEAKKYLFKITEKELLNKAALIMFEICNDEHDYTMLKQFLDEKNMLENIDLKIVNFLEKRTEKFNNEDLIKFLKIFSGNENRYAELCTIKLKDKLNENCTNEIFNFINNVEILEEPYFNNIIYFMLKNDLNVSGYIMYKDEIELNEALKLMADRYDDLSNLLVERLHRIKNLDDLYEENRIKKILCRCILLLQGIGDKEYNEIFNEYINVGIEYIKGKYNSNILSSERTYEFNSHEETFFFYIMRALDCKDNESKGYFKYLKLALKIYPDMFKGIDNMIIEFEKNLEFENYKFQIKNTIKNLIESNKLEEAKVIISQYESIVENDIEIVMFKSKINVMEIQYRANNKGERYKM